MYRKLMDDLINWKDSANRKPLILRGARQVGKTWLLREFGRENYKNVAEFNFDYDENLASIFKNTKDVNRILEQLAFVYGSKIEKDATLIIFDEIQECPDALNSLKYFCENANEYHIASAGSLLGITLSHTSFPVGKVDFLDLGPLSFNEFLCADNCTNLIQYMDSIKKIENIPDIFFNMLEEKLKAYFVIGGMPEVVQSWVNEKDMDRVNKLQSAILSAYKSDFSKHISDSEANKISLVWNSIPSQLARENKKFLYKVVKDGARAREYESSLNWLNDANLINKIYNAKEPNLPLSAYNDLSSFKIYLNDVGLLSKMANLDSKIVIEGDRLYKEFKGSLTENFCLSMLINVFNAIPNYYTFDRYEIDFLIQNKNEIIPIEIKSNISTNSISFTKYNELNKPRYRIRYSMNNLSVDGNLINIPLFMIEYTKGIIDMIDKI